MLALVSPLFALECSYGLDCPDEWDYDAEEVGECRPPEGFEQSLLVEMGSGIYGYTRVNDGCDPSCEDCPDDIVRDADIVFYRPEDVVLTPDGACRRAFAVVEGAAPLAVTETKGDGTFRIPLESGYYSATVSLAGACAYLSETTLVQPARVARVVIDTPTR